MKQRNIRHEFVDYIPEVLTEGTVYVCLQFATVVHKCCCGCGAEVVTPLSPTDWELLFNGVSISLSPSIGNWSFPCQSHYWIRRNRIEWAPRWSRERIAAGREFDAKLRSAYVSGPEVPADNPMPDGRPEHETDVRGSFWQRLRKRWF
jgi:Family of unknown function (DUF6527)